MPIIRGKHQFDGHFTQIPNHWLRDKRLSYKARGLLAELLTHSIGFEISRERLSRSGQDGDRSIRTAIAELEAVGYLKRSQSRSGSQQWGPAIWVTCDPEEPSVRFAPTGFAPADNDALKNNEIKNNEIKKDLAQILEQFDLFWNAYPRRVGKAAARKIFEKVWEPGLDLVKAATRLANDPNLPAQQFIPHPATWLGREGWNDEAYPERDLSPEEKASRQKAENERKRLIAIEESARMLKESQEARRNVELNPPKRCEHDRVEVICPKCSNANKKQELANEQDQTEGN